MFGSHLSIAGGLENALIEARGLGLECVQIFTKNQRQWSAPALSEEQVARWRSHRESTGIGVVVSHDSYLVNLAAPGGPTREKSVALYRDEIERCERLEIPYLVSHPGSHMGQGEEEGMARVAWALDVVHEGLRGCKTISCLEVTAGQGTGLGYRFEQLRGIRERVREPERVAYCLDTAHLIEAGYDLTSKAGMEETLGMAERVLGLERIKVWHVNDSKTPRGSRVDRHQHIGKGHVSLEAFAVLVNHPSFKRAPKILETPKEETGEGEPWDLVNLRALKGLMRGKKSKGKGGK